MSDEPSRRISSRDVQCPQCTADPGDPCYRRLATGPPFPKGPVKSHRSRIDLARDLARQP